MSPKETKRIGDLHELPACAPDYLKALLAISEGVLHDQVELLGTGKPFEVPDVYELLREQGITDPEDQGTMIDKYNKHKTEVDKVKSDYRDKDDGVLVETSDVSSRVNAAYDVIETSVGELNLKIDAAREAVITATDEDTGVVTKTLPKEWEDIVFTAIGETLKTTFEEVEEVSDQAAGAARKITGNEPSYTPTYRTNGNFAPSSNTISEFSSAYASAGDGGGPVTSTSGVPTVDPPGEVKEWIAEAIEVLRQNGYDVKDSDAAIIAKMIEKESSNNPNAINLWDSNAKKGTPSKGLMQTIDPTFNAHKLPGHDDIWDPVDNICAGAAYAIDRYGSLSNVPGIVNLSDSNANTGYVGY
ncbi:transglycosylase SLT domain-containing protein [Nocardia sp. NBC_01329]|uniref:transglycosylase SLT domain-containing protein n=1 Tax=Nocardia sp. NBC_01329 TaxID=2903594 RepID=UPI002E13413E|nr:transglycosylase SLT domain-containing protein [Nocardia sp. NBC_01329]